MPDTAQLLTKAVIPQRPVAGGYVSRTRPAPKGFNEPVWVIVPSHSTEVAIPCDWPASHGATLPVQGTRVTVVYDENDVAVVVSWKGEHS